MKSPIVTENGRRAKTNPDQSSLISYSTNKSCASSERKTQVKVACKVLCEMREDESSKLAMKFTQLRIVLATQSLLHQLQKYKSAKLQTYFWILQQDRKTTQSNGFLDLNPTLLLPNFIEDLHNNQIVEQIQPKQYPQISTSTVLVLYLVLNKLINLQQKQTFKRIKAQYHYYKGIVQIINFITQCQKKSKYLSILNIMRCNLNRKVLKTSVLDQSHVIQQEDELEQSNNEQSEEMSMKEQLAIKFASTTILSSILNEKIKKQQFSLFFNIVRGHIQNKQLSFSQTNEITQIYDKSYQDLNLNPIAIGTQRLCPIIYMRLKDYYQAIKKFNEETEINEINDQDSVNTLILNKNSEQSNNNSYEDLYTQRILPTQSKQDEEEDENEIQSHENLNEFKMPCSLQHIADIDDSTKEGENKQQQQEEKIELQQPKIIHQKNKNQDQIKNAVKFYCNLQQRKQSLQNTPRISQKDQPQVQVKEIQENKKQLKKFSLPCMIGLGMIILIILILQ